MKITSQIFQAQLKCNTKCWLRSAGQTGKQNAYAEWDEIQNDSYREKGIKRLLEGLQQEKYVFSPKAKDLKQARWHLAVNLSLECLYQEKRPPEPNQKISSITRRIAPMNLSRSQRSEIVLATNLHAVQRVPPELRGKNSQYFPIRFVFRNKLTIEDKLTLAFDAMVLSRMLRHNASYGKIVHGNGNCISRIKIPNLLGKVRKRIENIITLLSNSSPPDLVLNRNCTECEFETDCHKMATEKDELTLLAGMGLKERGGYHKKGIFTTTQLSYTFRPRKRPKRLRDKPEKYHHSLKALAIREKKIYIVGNPLLKIEGIPVFLDVEALPDRDFYYLIGARIRSKNSNTQHSLWAESINEEEAIWRKFLNILASIDRPVLVHYGSFETIFLKHMTDKYGRPPAGSDSAEAIESTVNLLSLVFAQVYFPCYSNGLKEISRFLGFEWSEPNASGIQTILWREEWQNSGDNSLKKKLITYNSEDCEATCRIMDCLTNLTTCNPNIPGTSPIVVHAESLPRTSHFHFRKIQFALPEFEEINQASYWDYQRDRLLVRSSGSSSKRAPRRITKQRNPRLRVSKIIDCPRPLRCPFCGGKKIYRHQVYTKLVFDIQFHRSGVKRWIKKYLFGRYRCAACWAVFRGSQKDWGKEKFGVNLRTLSVYLNIGLRLPQRRVSLFLNDVFGFSFYRTVTSILKASAATYYKPTSERLLGKMISGRLIHADETKVNLKEGIGYVWAFSNMEEVVYLYAPTREGGWVLDLLKEFTGVLVSDFYSAYDSLPCPKQRCLIHLIRDINDDLLENPFNDEIRSLASAFAAIVKPMIETVDRFGLKSRFLRKHKKDVERFFKSLSRQSYLTEIAGKWRTRLLKNKMQLFTFLYFDDIPWNNNNAEHAVRAFVVLRRDLVGNSTERGIRDYLILLSVCETCRIRGLSFLEFLRSGERDIEAFTSKRFGKSLPKSMPVQGTPLHMASLLSDLEDAQENS
jgi:predicted RecB family nuclease